MTTFTDSGTGAPKNPSYHWGGSNSKWNDVHEYVANTMKVATKDQMRKDTGWHWLQWESEDEAKRAAASAQGRVRENREGTRLQTAIRPDPNNEGKWLSYLRLVPEE